MSYKFNLTWGIGHWALSMGHGALGIVKTLSSSPHLPHPPHPPDLEK
ncbi:hypothetical protein [Nostoc sp.]